MVALVKILCNLVLPFKVKENIKIYRFSCTVDGNTFIASFLPIYML